MRTFNAHPILGLKGHTKESLFSQLSYTFDYALPQGWLDKFADWCEKYRPFVTYQLILSTTVWGYPDSVGRPVTCCTEVAEAYRAMEGEVLCTRNHHADLRSGDWDERAGGSLHCIECGKRIGAFRQ